jgi:hypothetical protein
VIGSSHSARAPRIGPVGTALVGIARFAPDNLILSRAQPESEHANVASNTVRHRFHNHQSLINLRIQSEFLTMLKLRNRLVFMFLEQIIFRRITRTSATFTYFSAAVNSHNLITASLIEG